MAEVRDALGRVISRRGFLGTTALAALGIAGAGSLAGCAGGSSGGPGGGSGGGEQGDAASGRGGAVTWASWANPGEAGRVRPGVKGYPSQHDTKNTYQNVTR